VYYLTGGEKNLLDKEPSGDQRIHSALNSCAVNICILPLVKRQQCMPRSGLLKCFEILRWRSKLSFQAV